MTPGSEIGAEREVIFGRGEGVNVPGPGDVEPDEEGKEEYPRAGPHPHQKIAGDEVAVLVMRECHVVPPLVPRRSHIEEHDSGKALKSDRQGSRLQEGEERIPE